MKMRKVQSRLRCPMCNTEGTKVITVSLKAPNLDDDDKAMEIAVKQLKDSYGTKIDSVVRSIKSTLWQKPEDKVRSVRVQTACTCRQRLFVSSVFSLGTACLEEVEVCIA